MVLLGRLRLPTGNDVRLRICTGDVLTFTGWMKDKQIPIQSLINGWCKVEWVPLCVSHDGAAFVLPYQLVRVDADEKVYRGKGNFGLTQL